MASEEKIFNKGEESMVDTPKELINSTIEKVEAILGKKFPEYLSFDKGSYTISRGSSQVMIAVRPFTENETIVECISNVVTDAKVDDKLMQYLLRKNAEMHFGSFGLLFDNTIIFQHSIAGTNLDENELLTAVNAVAIISDHYDDEIVNMAGGLRAADVLNIDEED